MKKQKKIFLSYHPHDIEKISGIKNELSELYEIIPYNSPKNGLYAQPFEGYSNLPNKPDLVIIFWSRNTRKDEVKNLEYSYDDKLFYVDLEDNSEEYPAPEYFDDKCYYIDSEVHIKLLKDSIKVRFNSY